MGVFVDMLFVQVTQLMKGKKTSLESVISPVVLFKLVRCNLQSSRDRVKVTF